VASGLIDKISDKLTRDATIDEAPVVKERIHDHYDHVYKSHVDEVRDRTKIETLIQPVLDEQHNREDIRRVDEGEYIREHGQAGLDANAEAQLRARREEVARQGGTEYSETRRDINERPAVAVSEHTHRIEQVQPVVERDIYNPHRVEHHKREIEIIHEAPTVGGTRVLPPVTVAEYERAHGTNLHTVTTNTTERRAVERSSISSSSSSSSDEGTTSTTTTTTTTTGTSGNTGSYLNANNVSSV